LSLHKKGRCFRDHREKEDKLGGEQKGALILEKKKSGPAEGEVEGPQNK